MNGNILTYIPAEFFFLLLLDTDRNLMKILQVFASKLAAFYNYKVWKKKSAK